MKKKAAGKSQSETPKDQELDQLVKFFKKNKGVIIVSLIFIVVIFSISMFYVNYSRQQKDNAWAELFKATTGNSDVTTLEGILDKIKGTSAEPWALYSICIKHFKDGNYSLAKDSLDKLEQSFGDHYIFQNPQMAPDFKRLLYAELKWNEEHPLPEETASADEFPFSESPVQNEGEAPEVGSELDESTSTEEADEPGIEKDSGSSF